MSAGCRFCEASNVLPIPGRPIGIITTTEVGEWLECFNADSSFTGSVLTLGCS